MGGVRFRTPPCLYQDDMFVSDLRTQSTSDVVLNQIYFFLLSFYGQALKFGRVTGNAPGQRHRG